eukprot:TRINITY_DN122499_c0_g1_i1.p1 TRINITY_DN122499_c0_g1~~TRINITY_DN122499_c0_g1_i1.p1  ORF type:complete len:280 (+),score=56.09 TRINITY_DN122499_c0_g1_i1:115-954(+)
MGGWWWCNTRRSWRRWVWYDGEDDAEHGAAVAAGVRSYDTGWDILLKKDAGRWRRTTRSEREALRSQRRGLAALDDDSDLDGEPKVNMKDRANELLDNEREEDAGETVVEEGPATLGHRTDQDGEPKVAEQVELQTEEIAEVKKAGLEHYAETTCVEQDRVEDDVEVSTYQDLADMEKSLVHAVAYSYRVGDGRGAHGRRCGAHWRKRAGGDEFKLNATRTTEDSDISDECLSAGADTQQSDVCYGFSDASKQLLLDEMSKLREQFSEMADKVGFAALP